MAELSTLVEDLDTELRLGEIEDYPNALNGLQLENRSGQVERIVAAVDASSFTIDHACQLGADLLIVHHGMLWGGTLPYTGSNFRALSRAIEGDLAVYSVHLPLDAHPELGNNILLARAIGLTETNPFLPHKGTEIGFHGKLSIRRDDLMRVVQKAVGGGTVHLAPGGPEDIGHIGVCSGGSGGKVLEAKAAGCDTFITGEGPHHTYLMAMEAGVNLIYAGHYATETFGVKAVAQWLSLRHGLSWEFIDHPSGL